MAQLEMIRAKSTWGQVIEGQLQHAGIALLMAMGALAMLLTPSEAPKLLGMTASEWALLSISLAVLHQVVVAIVFRLQLHKNLMTRLFDERDMKIWAIIFMPLLVARPLGVIMVGWADTEPITSLREVEIAVGLLLVGVAAWGMHSTLFHFTLPRALGGDHFRDHFAEMPLVKKGVFKYTDNGMYGVVFLGLWGIALLFGSWNAMVVALFQHSYIWVHMYCTEAPDMRRIYGA